MALLLMEGFDSYANNSDLYNNPTYLNTGAFTNGSSGRFGGGCILDINGPSTMVFAGPLTEFWTGRAVSFTQIGLYPLFDGLSGGSNMPSIQIDTNLGQLYINSLYVGSEHVQKENQYQWWEMHYKSATTNSSNDGVLEIWCDNVQVYTSSTMAQYGGVNSMNLGSGRGSESVFTDDIYVVDTTGSSPLNGRLGDLRIAQILPASDASPNDGVPSSGSTHYSLVNQGEGYNGSNYLTLTNTSGQEERFGVSSMPTDSSVILAVSTVSVASKTNAGSANAEMDIVSSGSTSTSPSYTLNTTVEFVRAYFTTDPHTSAAWTAAAVNAMDIGFKVP